MADFLYAADGLHPDQPLRLPGTVAVYAPAVQIDSGLLLVVGGHRGSAAPEAALACGRGNNTLRPVLRSRHTGRRRTFGAGGGCRVCDLAVDLCRLARRSAAENSGVILPLVLAHTILGGSSGVGRSILLAMGKAKPFAITMLVAGVANVICSYVFVARMGRDDAA